MGQYPLKNKFIGVGKAVSKHELKKCPRCGEEFDCKPGSIAICQCQAVELNRQQADDVAARYNDCLCSGCLTELHTECNESTGTERNMWGKKKPVSTEK